MQKLSIISTLIAAFRLGWQHRWLVLVLAVICGVPTNVMSVIVLQLAPPSTTAHVQPNTAEAGMNAALIGMSALACFIISVVVNNMATASLLGVLKVKPPNAELWPTIKEGIRFYTWPLIIVAILLSIVAFAITIPFYAVIALFGFHLDPGEKDPVVYTYFIEFIAFLMAVVYLVFIKYALASPVIVVERKTAMLALKRSWQMTRGFFWFVFGSYVFLGAAEYGLDALFPRLESLPGYAWVMFIRMLFDGVIQFYWILLGWCMYWRIREAEEPPSFVPETAEHL